MVHTFYKIGLIFVIILLLSTPLWGMEKIIEGKGDILGKALYMAQDGSIILVGSTMSPSFGMKDMYIAKAKKNGNIIWQRHYGGFFDDWAEDLYVGKYIYIIGTTYSFGTGCGDVCFLEYTTSGKKRFMIPYGTTSCEEAKAMVKTDDGFVVLAKKKDAKFSYLLFLDKNGILRKILDIPHLEYPEGLLYKRDMGYVIYGGTHDFDHDFKVGAYIVFLNTDGKMVWDKVMGEDTEYFIKDASWTDYGILFAGFSGLSLYNFWSPLIVKLDTAGNLVSEKSYKLKDSAGILTISLKNKTLYGGGFTKKGHLQPALFHIKDKDIDQKHLNYSGEIRDIVYNRGIIYYTGYIEKDGKDALLFGSTKGF